MEPARGESCHYGQRRRPAVLREDQVLSSDDKSLHFHYNSNNPGTKKEIARVDTAPQGVEPQPQGVIADWLGLMEPALGESCPSGQRRGPATPGEDKVSSPD